MMRHKNKIFALKSTNGDWVFNEDEIESMITAHFKQLFMDPSPSTAFNLQGDVLIKSVLDPSLNHLVSTLSSSL